ncbi:MAG: xanthine dehydrogenase family protein, partial [Candidatus Marinimicrobia bacterium]|nr:xanthine dehydrogenase family protein [Candidatus Neomarinimicrobiota bacterium]
MGTDFSYIGKSIRRVDASAKVTGETRFLTDMSVDRMVFAYPVYSTIPYGKVKSIDLSRAEAVNGFIDVVFAHHIPGENQVGVIIQDQPVLADEMVRYVGDTIGVVIAETESAAQKIASLVHIEYEEFEPYLSIDASKAATNNFFHKSNVTCSHKVDKGDIEKGFEQADFIIEETFRTPYQEHFYLEPQGCIAIPEDDGTITLYGSLQCPYYVQKAVANILDLPLDKVRVIQAPTGGAFGGKEDIPSEVCARAALAAIRVKRPVKMVYRRRDDVQMTSKRHPFQMHYKIGVTKEGKLISADIQLEENAGAYATLSSVVSYRAAMQSMGPYVIPNIRVKSTSYYTNLPPAGAFRGFGSPQATFGHERIMDIIAEKLGLDPVEFRLKNIVKLGDTTLTNHKLTASVGAEETIRQARKAANWVEQRQNNNSSERYVEGMGIATSHYGNCLGAAGWSMDGAEVKIQIHPDGSITVAFGLIEMGQGALTVVAQMTADALGVSMDRISVLTTDSRNVQDSG